LEIGGRHGRQFVLCQGSSHNLQGVIDGGVDKAGMSTEASDRSSTL